MGWKNLKRVPKVKSVMTPFPYSISSDETLARAEEMMASHEIRHLPVMKDKKTVGVVSARDLARAGKEQRTVGDVAHLEAFVVDLSTPLDRVLVHMANNHIDAALVVKMDRLVGIFTLTDACRQFAECLQAIFPPSDGNEAA